MPINSRSKGCRGERMWRDFLKNEGFSAYRGQQFSGSTDSPDVVCEEMRAWFHPEVKFVEKLNIRNAMAQAENDAGELMPYVAHKQSHKKWLVTLDARDFLGLAATFLEYQGVKLKPSNENESA